jgi:hypothetical protein
MVLFWYGGKSLAGSQQGIADLTPDGGRFIDELIEKKRISTSQLCYFSVG